ncbi:sulfate/molybdate ABC transporter ATP-binding protein [Planctomicrobium piriforme]|uniref:Sulfate transport system ATP-binding protein n=1 Tax=Planctomicrobium piriforme TaxID=1576369 RepID=A0A1I3F4V4_9PLAN|nr:sulfate/molybdate ABC transporter ATP-binding protein [Planctomicrobium piriforme]SFI06234.1 sulfate transport system ATP-binding protein [Planctomicrobium piriforme]
MSITIRHITKKFGNFTALENVSLEVPSGCLLALLGPSGSGKTSLLRIIAGLEHADRGSILFQDEDVTRQAARDRGVGFVFQHYALFRHMTVFENVAFGMRVRKLPKAEVNERVHELLALVRLEGLGHRYPSELSGGQRQRVALARALAVRPRMLLLDEPFGALDAKVRQELRSWLRRLHEEMHVTTVFVTHDQEEAFEVADKVVVMRQGKIEQIGTPQQVFDHPATPFVMDFLGNVNVFHGRVQAGTAHVGPFQLAYDDYQHDEPREATAYVRPHELEIERSPSTTAALQGVVVQINPSGAVVKVRVRLDEFGLELTVDLVRDRAQLLALKLNDVVFVRPKSARVFMPEIEYSI